MGYPRREGPCTVPGCEGGKIVAKGLCRHHYDHRYDHYKVTGEILTVQQMADNPRKRVPRKGNWKGRSTGHWGPTLPHPEGPGKVKVDLNDPEVRRHTMVAMSDHVDVALPNAWGSTEPSAKSDTSPQKEKILPPPQLALKALPRRKEVNIRREILIARLEWLHQQVALTIRELTEN